MSLATPKKNPQKNDHYSSTVYVINVNLLKEGNYKDK